jgi:hypothetical protein
VAPILGRPAPRPALPVDLQPQITPAYMSEPSAALSEEHIPLAVTVPHPPPLSAEGPAAEDTLDWMTVVLSALAFVAVTGLVPLWLWVLHHWGFF